jgi:hypothetical protein
MATLANGMNGKPTAMKNVRIGMRSLGEPCLALRRTRETPETVFALARWFAHLQRTLEFCSILHRIRARNSYDIAWCCALSGR